MRIKLVSLEDGITSCGFRKMAAYSTRINPDTESYYVTTKRYYNLRDALFGSFDTCDLGDDEIDEIAQGLADADLIGFSSMTGYAGTTHRVIKRVRDLRPDAFIVWGGIHPIIQPEDAILAPVDAICTGEGEFAFEQLVDSLNSGRDFTGIRNFWFKRDQEVIRNDFFPLMTPAEMDRLPFPHYGEGEKIYREGKGFESMTLGDYIKHEGLVYSTLWSIGCPFRCSYCGNTKFIENDASYTKIRHTSARYIVDEVNRVRERLPHVNHVSFHDDSFMAIPYRQLEEFAQLWHDEVKIPFMVFGVIPNYVRQDKFEILTWAGMNRVRMGIQSGSQAILDFYKRPTPPEKIREAAGIISNFTPRYHLPPNYDIITDNPIETRQDVIDTLEMLYAMPRPYTFNIFSLKVIPNTGLARDMQERGINLEEIDSSYLSIPPRVANLLLYLLAVWKPPRWLFDKLLERVEASGTPQPLYPKTSVVLRALFFGSRALSHLVKMDFAPIPGWSSYLAYRIGLISFWQRHLIHHMPRPTAPRRHTVEEAAPGAAVPFDPLVIASDAGIEQPAAGLFDNPSVQR